MAHLCAPPHPLPPPRPSSSPRLHLPTLRPPIVAARDHHRLSSEKRTLPRSKDRDAPPHPSTLLPSQALGLVVASQANFMRVVVSEPAHAAGEELLCVVRALLKKIGWRVVVGDRVLVGGVDWTEGRGMVEEAFRRETELADPPVANVDHLLVLFSLGRPEIVPLTLTRFLVEAESIGTPLTLAINKADLASDDVRRVDVLSAWSGIRPLAMDPSAKNTESISRDHVLVEDIPGLITITGGKWTTYRSMAEDVVDKAIQSGGLNPSNGCVTQHLRIVGADSWEPSCFTILSQHYMRMKRTRSGKVVPGVMDSAVSKHLAHAYGSLAERVAVIAQNENLGKRLAHGYPYLEAEVAYCARQEYCESAVDFIARRSRLAFLDTDAAGRALPRVVEILAAEHKWDRSRQKRELQDGKRFLETFKSSKNAQFHDGKHSG